MRLTLLFLAALFLSAATPAVAKGRHEVAGTSSGVAAAPHTRFLNENGRYQRGHRCSTRPLTAGEAALVEEGLAVRRHMRPKEAPLDDPIPVAVHVIYSKKRGKRPVGNVSDERIEEQIEALNRGFAGTGIAFRLSSVDRKRRNKWYTRCMGSAELRMKRKLAVDPATTLNLYLCKPAGGHLGYARFPWEAEEESYEHGVILRHSTLPGGHAAPYNLGATAVHEVGHYLGLFHTFQEGCFEPGDSVADTAPEGYPAFGCPVGRDSCIGGGVDPVSNFMDYSDDACMDGFTPGQAARMREVVSAFRPGL